MDANTRMSGMHSSIAVKPAFDIASSFLGRVFQSCILPSKLHKRRGLTQGTIVGEPLLRVSLFHVESRKSKVESQDEVVIHFV